VTIPVGGVDHALLIDADGLHELKGHSTATLHSIPMSKGDGTTFWAKPAEETFVPTVSGQTSFSLARATALQGVTGLKRIEVNGVDSASLFTIVGSSLTYIGTGYTMDVTDEIFVVYYYTA